jgi:hypothetical protein
MACDGTGSKQKTEGARLSEPQSNPEVKTRIKHKIVIQNFNSAKIKDYFEKCKILMKECNVSL